MDGTTATGALEGLALRPIGQNPSMGRWRTEAMRAHATPRLMFVTRGQGRITIAGLKSGYGPNNLIYIPAGTMYGYELGTGVHGQMLTIPRAMAGEWPDEPVHLRLKDVLGQRDIAAAFEALERELRSGSLGAGRAAHYHLGLLAIQVQRQIGTTAPATDGRAGASAARLVAAYTDLIERDFRQGLPVAHYARSLGVTPTHLSRCCRQTCGQAAHALLTDRVFYEARLLLRDSHLPIAAISRALGYRSPAYFSRHFHDKTGMTPTTFRRQGAAEPGSTPKPTGSTSLS